MNVRSGVLAIGVGHCWQTYQATGGVEVAACYLERRDDGLRGLLKKDLRGWYVSGLRGERVNVPASVVESIKGTAPYGIPLLEQQADLAYDPAYRRKVRGYPSHVDCPDCGARVVVA